MRLEAFYEQHKDGLVAALTRYSRDAEGAADAVQEAFVKALNKRNLIPSQEKPLWSWLYTTAKNALTDEKRKTSRIDNYDGFDGIDPAGDPTDTIMVRDLLHKLPPDLMHTVSLRYFGGLNSTEIGAMKDMPPSTVRAQLKTALSILKKHAV